MEKPENFVKFYNSKLAPMLGIREDGFRKIFELLEEKKVKN